LLTIGTITLIANGFLQNDWKERWNVFMQHTFLVGISCLFVLPFISGLWSEDKAEWLHTLKIKLPLLLLPFALVMQKGFERKQVVFFSLLWIALLFGGTTWSIVQYLQQKEEYDLLYRFSKTIPTPAGNDHIRFSMAIIIALLLWLKLEEWKAVTSSTLLWIMRAVMAWFVLFLHILGAKTGLIGLYLVLVPLTVWQMYTAGKKGLAVTGVIVALLLPVLAYQLLPTFKARMHYVLYDRENWKAGNVSGDLSDGNRILSIRSGWHVFQQNWLTGVGYGDIKTETGKWYDVHAPAVPLSERFLPVNPWLTSGSGAGIAAVLLFTVVIFLPFFSKQWQQNKQTFAFLFYMNIIFLYECTIDDQFGVCLFSFFTLYWHLTNRFKP
jgi:O-antigen ligase